MFHRIKRQKPFKRALFTLLVGFSVVAFWRGAWGIMDIYLFPNNYKLSSWLSIAVGLIILWLTNHWTKELT